MKNNLDVITLEKRLMQSCPYCNYTKIHYNKTLHTYYCSKCKERFPRHKLVHREATTSSHLPTLLAKILKMNANKFTTNGGSAHK